MTLEDLELMPEPEDSRLLTAVDPQAPGYPGSEYGLSDQEARELRWPLGPMKEFLWPWGAASFAIGAVLLVMTWSSVILRYWLLVVLSMERTIGREFGDLEDQDPLLVNP